METISAPTFSVQSALANREVAGYIKLVSMSQKEASQILSSHWQDIICDFNKLDASRGKEIDFKGKEFHGINPQVRSQELFGRICANYLNQHVFGLDAKFMSSICRQETGFLSVKSKKGNGYFQVTSNTLKDLASPDRLAILNSLVNGIYGLEKFKQDFFSYYDSPSKKQKPLFENQKQMDAALSDYAKSLVIASAILYLKIVDYAYKKFPGKNGYEKRVDLYSRFSHKTRELEEYSRIAQLYNSSAIQREYADSVSVSFQWLSESKNDKLAQISALPNSFKTLIRADFTSRPLSQLSLSKKQENILGPIVSDFQKTGQKMGFTQEQADAISLCAMFMFERAFDDKAAGKNSRNSSYILFARKCFESAGISSVLQIEQMLKSSQVPKNAGSFVLEQIPIAGGELEDALKKSLNMLKFSKQDILNFNTICLFANKNLGK